MEVINFSYNTNAVSKEQFEQHLKLYKGYIEKSNEISQGLLQPNIYEKPSSVYSKYRELKKEESYALDGVILHELYFDNMNNKKTLPGSKTTDAFNHYFGGYKGWEQDFKACSMSARGWCITAYEQRTNSLKNILLDSHDDGLICLSFPILIIDMYEHAYFMDYGTKKDEYIKNFISSINWESVEKRLKRIL